MPKMTAMAAGVKVLESEGVKHIFGIPGAGILPFYRALKDLGTIKHMAAAGGKAGGIVADSRHASLQPENQGRGFDFVKFAEACGTLVERITDPSELKAAFQRVSSLVYHIS